MELCSDCPPVDYPTDKTRCAECPRRAEDQEPDDICGLCGEPGADKIPHPCHWPGERVPDPWLVHSECEQEECKRAHAALSDAQRDRFLSSLRF